MRMILALILICAAGLAVGCAKENSSGVLSSRDFRLTPEEDRLAEALGGAIAKGGSEQVMVLKILGFPQNPEIRSKLEKYLKEVHNSSQAKEEALAKSIFRDYMQAIAEHAERQTQCHGNDIIGTAWLDDLKKQFGEPYVKQHRTDIAGLLFHLSIQKKLACMDPQRKNLLYAEWRYHSLQKWHAETLAEFYESDELTKDEKKELKPALETAKLYLGLMTKSSVANLLFWKEELETEDEIKAAPPELASFLGSYPAFSQPFSFNLSSITETLDAL